MTRRVLVVEDDPDIGRLVTLRLAELDCERYIFFQKITKHFFSSHSFLVYSLFWHHYY